MSIDPLLDLKQWSIAVCSIKNKKSCVRSNKHQGEVPDSMDYVLTGQTELFRLFRKNSRNSHDQLCKFVMRLGVLSLYKFGFNNSSVAMAMS